MIERKITIGLISHTEYIIQISKIWDIGLIEGPICKRICTWVMDYYNKYNKAPKENIEIIYHQKVKEGLNKDIAEGVEEMLQELNEEFLEESFNINYLLDQTYSYFKERSLSNHSDTIKSLIINNELDEAEKEANNYKSIIEGSKEDLNLNEKIAIDRVEKAFNTTQNSIIYYPGKLGEFWNHQLVRGGFVALMGPEKRGKTFWLLDLAVRAAKQKKKVVFFQAGDMTEDQQLRRLCIYLNKKSDIGKYCGEMFEPVKDCIENQMDKCDKDERECDFGIFDTCHEKEIKNDLVFKDYKEAFLDNEEYHACHNCKEYSKRNLGAVWYQKINIKSPLTVTEAKNSINKFFINKRKFKLSTHANSTLSVKNIKTLLSIWEKTEDFIPDVIVIDYADLLINDYKTEFRHQQNEIWKGLRNISQERDCLLITATQADAKSYEQNTLKLSNFSEDKRKYAHVTAMYGLNQDSKGREKELGLMRINELVIREGDFNVKNQVTVLQNLRRGRPFLSSF